MLTTILLYLLYFFGGLAILCIYITIGYFYDYAITKSDYYQTNFLSKILFPFAPFCKKLSPFVKKIHKNKEERQSNYPDFTKYYCDNNLITIIVFWPPVALLIFTFIVVTWVTQIFVWSWKGLLWILKGGIFKKIIKLP